VSLVIATDSGGWAATLAASAMAASKDFSGIGDLLHQTPLIGFRCRDALVGQDHGLLGARRSDQVQHARHALPAHVHAEPDLGHPHMGVTRHDAEVERDCERKAAADRKSPSMASMAICSISCQAPRQPRPEFSGAGAACRDPWYGARGLRDP